jgi:hypothetical protein
MVSSISDPSLGANVTPPFIELGQQMVQQVKETNDRQELVLRSHLPDAITRLWELTGVVYRVVRKINDRAQWVHATDRAKAAQYNLDLFNRKSRSPGAIPSLETTSVLPGLAAPAA